MNELDAAQFEALGPWITGFEFGGSHSGGQYRADTDSRVLRFRERLAAWNRGRDQPLRILDPGWQRSCRPTESGKDFDYRRLVKAARGPNEIVD